MFLVVTIGFDPEEEYTVSEKGGNITLNVYLFNGSLERDVVVNFETEIGTATSELPGAIVQ